MARVMDYLNRVRQETPKQEIGIGGFTALVRVRERYTLEADAPDTPVEDGSFVNDHIIRKPVRISIEGDVSDVHLRGQPILRDIRQLQAEIGNVTSQYAPARTQAQLSRVSALANDALDAVRRVDALLDAGEQIGSLFGNQDAQAKPLREQFIDHMEALHNGKQLISIDMPYRRLDAMVITSLTFAYDNETEVTTFTLEAKKLQFAALEFAQIRRPARGLGGQTSSQVDNGPQEGDRVERSLITNIFGYVREGF